MTSLPAVATCGLFLPEVIGLVVLATDWRHQHQARELADAIAVEVVGKLPQAGSGDTLNAISEHLSRLIRIRTGRIKSTAQLAATGAALVALGAVKQDFLVALLTLCCWLALFVVEKHCWDGAREDTIGRIERQHCWLNLALILLGAGAKAYLYLAR